MAPAALRLDRPGAAAGIGVNEVVWRSTSTDLWVAYNAISGPGAFALYWLLTWSIATRYWTDEP